MFEFIKSTDVYKKFEVDELLFVEFKCPSDDPNTRTWWQNNFFAYAMSGESLLKTPKGEYHLRPGDCVFARKGSVISINEAHEDFCELMIFLPDDFIKTVIQKYSLALPQKIISGDGDTIIPLENDDILDVYFQSVLSYFSMHSPPATPLLRLKFEELVINIISNNKYLPLTSYFHEVCMRSKPSIKEIMECNFFSNLSLNEFAKLCGRSISSFKNEFSELYQTTPGKWLTQKRLDYSHYLLDTTNMSIDEVCFESGFQNRSHFIRIFKNKFGITPKQFMLQ